ncbi:hypothetical protein [Mesorhizobium mediterraneum]|uniref:hypothetical protein n=1 Tax=Mesorhizobium mediterraneum TaxID=43617 RepID=UPI00177FE8A4|nr:hypothetical protein [Mesorhizobium mediterraneum]
MAANFDNELVINEMGCISPAGPIGLEPGEVVLRLDAWVFQAGGACMSHVAGPFNGARWMTHPNPETEHIGDRFVPGPAKAVGLTVNLKSNGRTVTHVWNEEIHLKV